MFTGLVQDIGSVESVAGGGLVSVAMCSLFLLD